MGKYFGTDGVRGVAGADLTCELAMKIGRGAAAVLTGSTGHRPRILIGKDTRQSGDMLEAALTAGLCSVGADVESLGVVPTPAVAYLVRKYNADAGVVISASHNPMEFNGIKIFAGTGYKLPDEVENEIEAYIDNQCAGLKLATGDDVGRVTCRTDGIKDYTDHLYESINGDLSGLNVCIDCANGASAAAARQLFPRLGAKCTFIGVEPDGKNINAGVGSTHLDNLEKAVVEGGFDGGTGAAPRNSIHNAGLPWELGLAEAHQSLIMNGLRSRVRIEADSKLMSGRDVAIAAMLGAEEFGFGTGPLVAMGCVMMRVCNLDTCPMGICTQNPELRKRFKGKPEYIINFMRFMAEDLREYMARLGVHTVDELVGRTDLLKVKDAPAGSRASEMDLTALLKNPLVENSSVHFNAKDVYNFGLEKTPDMRVLMKKFKKSFDMAEPKPMTVELEVGNTDRAFGTIFGSEITRKFGNTLPEDTFHVICNGYGGQSFGAFIPAGLTLELVGDSNDYMGKGLSGGKLIVYPPKDVTYDRSENIVIGNVALYGATAGKAFINGVAGERFCVRNSGATAVVEGVGDHGCEYMTGGTVVVLGKTGKNFAAGMSGGIAYVLDEDWDFYTRVNKDMVSLEPVEHKYDVSLLKDLIREHVEATGSPRGKEILDNFGEYLPKFKKVLPHDYDKMLRLIAQMEEKGEDSEQAQIEAFYAMKNAANK